MRFIYTKIFAKIFTIFALIALLVILDAAGYLGYVKDVWFRVYGFTTLKLTTVTDSAKNSFGTLFAIKNLAHDNAALNQKVQELSFENARLQAAQNENTALRKALSYKQQSKFNLLPVEALTSDPTGFTQTIVIDKGENNQVKVDQPLVVAPGLLVGKVTKVYPDSAEVRLITDPSISVNAEVVDTGARGLIRGEHGLSLLFDLITQDEVIKTGDSVITSGLSDNFPRGLLIGQVTALRSKSSDLFQNAYVSAAADLRNLRFLFVIQ